MNYVVLDMEWNQPDSFKTMVRDCVMLEGEIIQIGAVKLDEHFREVGTFNKRVVPKYYKELTPAVAAVTKLRDNDLRRGEPFPQVFDEFCEWCGSDFAFLIWGTEDIHILRKNMVIHDIDTSCMPESYNLQCLFSSQITRDEKQYSLTKALEIVNETPFDAHDAFNDARSTVLLCNHLDMVRGLENYNSMSLPFMYRGGMIEQAVLEDSYIDIDDAMSDEYVVSFEHPDDGEIIWGEKWIPEKAWKKTRLIGIGYSEDGSGYLIKLRFSYAKDHFIRVKRAVYPMTPALQQLYNDCAKAWEKCQKLYARYVVTAPGA